jgi:hypothetical protein
MRRLKNNTIPDLAINAAIAWRANHPDHIARLISRSGTSYAPSETDAFRPELWKAPNWRWLKEVIDGGYSVYDTQKAEV